MHGDGRVPEQVLLGGLLPGVPEGDPDTAGDEHLMVVEGEGCPQLLYYPLSDAYRLARSHDVLKQDGELVPAQACDGVFRSQAGSQALRDCDEQFVSHVVSKGIVYEFEVVQVHEQHRDLAAPAIRTS
jgi:hypothetical protein